MRFLSFLTLKGLPLLEYNKVAMQQSWEDPHAAFLSRLVRERAIEFMRSKQYMKSLRHRNDEAINMQKRFGHIWEEYGTNVYELIAEAHGENWDAEDEEKHRGRDAKKEVAITQRARHDDDLVTAREEGPRRGQHELQGKPEASERELEEGEIGLSSSTEEKGAGPQKGCRREGFYRRAGGTCKTRQRAKLSSC